MASQPLIRDPAQADQAAALPTRLQRLWLACILAAGAALRFYQLGRDSLWLDEAGVAYAATAASLGEMLAVVRSHVLAMPLDYLVAWLAGRLSQSELALRIPAAAWGTLTLGLAYPFFRRFTGRPAALLGLLALALSPLHIQYSQELRFYASLVFFYLLASLALWDALQKPSTKRWVLFNAACVTGVFFHPYVLFSLANGLVWLALAGPAAWKDRRRRLPFLLSACLVLLVFLGGYLAFSAGNFFKIPLLSFEDSLLSALATGLGWQPFSPGRPGLSWAWGGLCALLQCAGAWVALKNGPRSGLAGLFYSLLLQLTAVLASDLAGRYFFAPRQLLFLLPVTSLLAGVGLAALTGWFAQRLNGLFPGVKADALRGGVSAAAVLLVVLTSLPAIRAYQADDKGDSRAIVQAILETWQPGDTILINPGYEGFVYKYYLENVYRRADAGERLWTAGWEDIRQTGTWSGGLYVITPARLTAEETAWMRDLGFSPRFRSAPQSRYAKVLWVREPPGR
jgi:hypothetical protein